MTTEIRTHTGPFLAAVVQLTSSADVERNLDTCRQLALRAAGRGARLIVLPENFAHMGPERERPGLAEPLGDGTPPGRILGAMAEVARAASAHLVLGGMPEASPIAGKVYNACLVLDPAGAVVGHYRKIHLFDIELPGLPVYRESDTFIGGEAPTVCATPLAALGLSVCYDLRFPELYRRLSELGAEVLLVPAAFTQHTGKDHWHALLRARAIENQCYLLAAGQLGHHGEKRVTYGHSLIVDPWGVVLAEAADEEGIAMAEIDLARLRALRRQMPCLAHRRLE